MGFEMRHHDSILAMFLRSIFSEFYHTGSAVYLAIGKIDLRLKTA
jgi:hypothetical protein